MKIRYLAYALSLPLIASCATTPTEDVRSVSVQSGQAVKVGNSSQWNAACQMTQIPTIMVVEPPKNGTTEVKRVLNKLGGGNVIGATSCAGYEIEGAGLFYTSNPGYHGTDRLRYTVYLQGQNGLPGHNLATTLNITVK